MGLKAFSCRKFPGFLNPSDGILANSILLKWSLANRQIISSLDFNLERCFFVLKTYLLWKLWLVSVKWRKLVWVCAWVGYFIYSGMKWPHILQNDSSISWEVKQTSRAREICKDWTLQCPPTVYRILIYYWGLKFFSIQLLPLKPFTAKTTKTQKT